MVQTSSVRFETFILYIAIIYCKDTIMYSIEQLLIRWHNQIFVNEDRLAKTLRDQFESTTAFHPRITIYCTIGGSKGKA